VDGRGGTTARRSNCVGGKGCLEDCPFGDRLEDSSCGSRRLLTGGDNSGQVGRFGGGRYSYRSAGAGLGRGARVVVKGPNRVRRSA